MKTTIHMVHPEKRGQKSSTATFGAESARQALHYHRSFPGYRETPLAELKELAALCGVKGIYVKDESLRFGLNAFKALGGSYAIGCEIADRLGASLSALPYEVLTSEETRRKLGALTFITATDGNHGRGVAWTAKQLGQHCVVYMPKGSSSERRRRLRLCDGAAAA